MPPPPPPHRRNNPSARQAAPHQPLRGGSSPRPPSHRPPAHRSPNAPSSAPSPQTIETHWDPVAEWYDALVGDDGSDFHKHVVIPGVLRLLKTGDVKAGQHMSEQQTSGQQTSGQGKSVLDIACGQGVLCRVLSAQGAAVTGIDASAQLIAAAKERLTSPPPPHAPTPSPTPAPNPSAQNAPTTPPTYFTGDARELKGLADSAYDAAACVLALQNIHPPQAVFSAVSRVLKPGGAFVVVIMHPCFRSIKASDWGWDDRAQVQFRRIDRYLSPRKEPIVAHPGKKDGSYTWTFHRPLQDYIRMATSAGLLLAGLEEWPSHKTSTSGPRAKAENTARSEIPMFMALKWQKISPPQTSAAPPA